MADDRSSESSETDDDPIRDRLIDVIAQAGGYPAIAAAAVEDEPDLW